MKESIMNRLDIFYLIFFIYNLNAITFLRYGVISELNKKQKCNFFIFSIYFMLFNVI